MRMTILQRYVLRELLVPLGLGLVVFTFVFLVGQVFQLADLLLNRGVPTLLALELVLSMLPAILSLTVPMAMLVAVLLGVGRLSADREILAIRASGVNIFHVCIPVIALAAICSGLLILVNQSVVPFLNLKTSDIATQIEFNVLANIPANSVFEMDQGDGAESTFFYEFRDPTTDDMRGVNINTTIEQEISDAQMLLLERRRDELRAKAQRGDLVTTEIEQLRAEVRRLEADNSTQQVFMTAHAGDISADLNERLITITLTSGSIHITDPKDALAYSIVRFDTMTKGIRPRFQRTEDGYWQKRPKEMTTEELRAHIRSGYRESRMRPELYTRFSIPLACIAFALTAIPLAVYARPTGKAIAFGISFLLIFVYYGLLNYGITLTKEGSSAGMFAVFFPNILLAVTGSVLLYRSVLR